MIDEPMKFEGRGHAERELKRLMLVERLRHAMRVAGFDPGRVSVTVKRSGDRCYAETIVVTDQNDDFDVASRAARWLEAALKEGGSKAWVEYADVGQPPMPRDVKHHAHKHGRGRHRCGVEMFVRFSGD
jgi:hypothetical protein